VTQSEYHSGGETSGIMVHEVLPSLHPLSGDQQVRPPWFLSFFFIRDLLGNGQKLFLLSKVNLMCNPIQKNKYLGIFYKNYINDLPFTGT
jgi:hypothetical protein